MENKKTKNKVLLGVIGAAIGATLGTGLLMLARSNMQEKSDVKGNKNKGEKIRVVRKTSKDTTKVSSL